MKKAILFQQAIDNISRLPEQQLKEINDFAEFLLSRIQQEILSEEVSNTNLASYSNKFLDQDEYLYTVNDLKGNTENEETEFWNARHARSSMGCIGLNQRTTENNRKIKLL